MTASSMAQPLAIANCNSQKSDFFLLESNVTYRIKLSLVVFYMYQMNSEVVFYEGLYI